MLLDLTEDQRKKLIILPREPAKLQNRRRATLVVTPASLLGHWLTQIHQHVDDSVNLKVAVHYGQCKALLGTELEDNDIVLTTYGTVGAEYRSYDSGPLLRAKWLRVVLDEGHFIKNHNSQTAKACYEDVAVNAYFGKGEKQRILDCVVDSVTNYTQNKI